MKFGSAPVVGALRFVRATILSLCRTLVEDQYQLGLFSKLRMGGRHDHSQEPGNSRRAGRRRRQRVRHPRKRGPGPAWGQATRRRGDQAVSRVDQVRAGFQFAEQAPGNIEFIFLTGDLMVPAGPATYLKYILTTDENGVL